MHKSLLFGLILLSLAGCATPQIYGNFANNPAMIDQAMAEDALKKVVTLYPPARTRFDLKQPATDPFGAALVQGLREQGYALSEYNPQAASMTEADLPLRYLLDRAGTSNLYRLTILVGDQSIARPYTKQQGALVPAGYWAHKE